MAVPSFHKIHNRHIIGWVQGHTVSEDFFIQTGFHCVTDRFGHGKIHIGNPHRDIVVGQIRVDDSGGVVLYAVVWCGR